MVGRRRSNSKTKSVDEEAPAIIENDLYDATWNAPASKSL